MLNRKNTIQTVAGMMIGVALLFWFFYGLEKQMTDYESRPCIWHIESSSRVLMDYAKKNGAFPAGNSLQVSKAPVVNWRAAVLPLKPYNDDLGKGYQYDEPWNSPENSKLHSVVCKEYHCHLDASPNTDTSYLTVQGPATFFPDNGTIKLSEHQDGLTNSILVVETHQSGIHWMEPRDLRIEDAVKGLNRPGSLSISSNHKYFSDRKRDGAFVSFADGRVQFLNSNIDPKLLRSLLEIDNPDKPKEKYISP